METRPVITAEEAVELYLRIHAAIDAGSLRLALSVDEFGAAASIGRSSAWNLIAERRLAARKVQPNGRTIVTVLEALTFLHTLPVVGE